MLFFFFVFLKFRLAIMLYCRYFCNTSVNLWHWPKPCMNVYPFDISHFLSERYRTRKKRNQRRKKRQENSAKRNLVWHKLILKTQITCISSAMQSSAKFLRFHNFAEVYVLCLKKCCPSITLYLSSLQFFSTFFFQCFLVNKDIWLDKI